MVTIDARKAKKVLEDLTRRVSEKDLLAVLRRRKEIEGKLEHTPGTLQKFVNQTMLLVSLVGDYRKGLYREIPWYTVATSVAALIYFLSPLDLIPDFIPLLGQIDDAIVISLAVKAVQEDLKKYATMKGFDLKKYF
jgi:uncharacterized membrane protein YkvA (DUF1232 family)